MRMMDLRTKSKSEHVLAKKGGQLSQEWEHLGPVLGRNGHILGPKTLMISTMGLKSRA
jgi:hypothetical protein